MITRIPCASSRTTRTIPSTERCTFEYSGITEIRLPDSLKFISTDAFFNSALTSVTIPGSVQSIGVNAFGYSSLKSVTIEDGVRCIGDSAFSYCGGLESIVIPKSVVRVGTKAFNNISYSARVYYEGSESDWTNVVIENENGWNDPSLSYFRRYYYSETQPATSNTYWRYVNGVPAIW